jgi:hypothetical protein
MKALRHRPDSEAARTYYAASAVTRWTYGLYYLVLALFLAVMVAQVNGLLRGERAADGSSTEAPPT